MWIVTNKGMLSIVQHEQSDKVVKIRARNKEAYEGFFKQDEILETPKNDYRFRVIATRSQLFNFLEYLQENIDYTNFKNSIQDEDLHKTANEIWACGYRMQLRRHPLKIVRSRRQHVSVKTHRGIYDDEELESFDDYVKGHRAYNTWDDV